MILLVDIGNTNTKIKLDELDEIFEIGTSPQYNYDIIFHSLPEFLKVKIDGAIMSSVVPNATLPIKNFIKEYYKVEPLVVNTSFKSRVSYPDIVKNELGTDMFTAINSLGKDNDTFLTIDCGTGTTYNLVVNRNYVGTAIAPGLILSHRSFVSAASLINYVNLVGDVKLLSNTTESCVRGGTVFGWSFMIDGYISAIKKEYNLPDLKVFITGGASDLVMPHLTNEVTQKKDLIIKGLIDLYNLNKE